MKKKIAFPFLALLIIILSLTYILIPGKIMISKTTKLRCTFEGALRTVLNMKKWEAWWQYSNQKDSLTAYSSLRTAEMPVFIFHNTEYQPLGIMYNGVQVKITDANFGVKSFLTVISLNKDSVALAWNCSEIKASLNPLKRLQQYFKAINISNNLREVTSSLKKFLENDENIYGIKVNEVKVKDSVLIATRFNTASYPSTEEIYTIIGKLKNYIAENHAIENNFPMMNVYTTDNTHFQTMIAIPVNKGLPEKNGMVVKKMVLGNILEAEVKGGNATVENGLVELENYKQDHAKESPAIPFQLLVTDRSMEKDTSKWITKIYYPVFF